MSSVFPRIALCLLLVGCATGAGSRVPETLPAAPVNEVSGRYRYASSLGDQPIDGIITIERSGAGHRIVMNTGGLTRDLLFTDVSETANAFTARTVAPSGAVATLRLVVNGDAISGDWAFNGRGGSVKGRRVAAE